MPPPTHTRSERSYGRASRREKALHSIALAVSTLQAATPLSRRARASASTREGEISGANQVSGLSYAIPLPGFSPGRLRTTLLHDSNNLRNTHKNVPVSSTPGQETEQRRGPNDETGNRTEHRCEESNCVTVRPQDQASAMIGQRGPKM